jgi:hypothetical protein
MANESNEILYPKALVLPIVKSGDNTNKAPIGSIMISGTKLYVCCQTAGVFQLVTST